MKAYEFEGAPIAWRRPARCGNRIFDSQLNEKNNLRSIIRIAEKDLKCSSKPLSIYYEFKMPIPPSWSKKRRLNAIGEVHTNTPDIDNLMKFINDVFNNILWKDDRQIAEVFATKRYATEPGTKIIIMEVEDD